MLGRRAVELEPERMTRRTDENNRYSSVLNKTELLGKVRKSHVLEGGDHEGNEDNKDAMNQVNNLFSGGLNLSGGIRNLVSEKTDYI